MDMLLVVLLASLPLSLEGTFGDSITLTEEIKVNATQVPRETPEVLAFDVYDEGGVDQLNLTFLVPISDYKGPNTADFWIIDFDRYSPSYNPIDSENTLQPNRTSNCSNLIHATSLSSLFIHLSEPTSSAADPYLDFDENGTHTDNPFFKVEFRILRNKTYFTLSYNGTLEYFTQCITPGGDDVWTESRTGRGFEYSTTLYANNIASKAVPTVNGTVYHTSYFSTTFLFRWRISQYIVVNTLVASMKRLEAELVYSSVQPEWVDGRPTTRTQVYLGIRTILSGAYLNSVMMVYRNDTVWFGGIIGIDSKRVAYKVVSQPPTDYRDNTCTKHYTYLEAAKESEDCIQLWEFAIVIEDNLSGVSTLSGVFYFDLDMYNCADLDAGSLTCSIADTRIGSKPETISAQLQLDTIVEVTDEKESDLALQVNYISNGAGTTDFLHGGNNTRGIYHREEVVIDVSPVRDYAQISEYGLELSAFFVCFQSKVPRTSRLGCIDVEREYRYIAFLDENISLSLHGKTYQKKDFEEPKQQLTYKNWSETHKTFTIRFINLALSGESRVYQITMLFSLGVNQSDPEARNIGKRAATVNAEATPFTPTEKPIDGDNTGDKEQDTTGDETPDTTGDETPNTTPAPEAADNTTYTTSDNTTAQPDDTAAEDDPGAPKEITTEEETTDANPSKEEDTTDDNPPKQSTPHTSVNVLAGGCADGYRFVSIDETCKPVKNGAGSITSAAVLLVVLSVLVV